MPEETVSVSPKLAAIKEKIESALKILALSGLLFYGIGIVVANSYLSRFSTTDFSILKPQCLLTGVWTLGVIALAILPGAGSLFVATSDAPLRLKLLRLSLGFTLAVFLDDFFASFFYHILSDLDFSIPFLSGMGPLPFSSGMNPFHWGTPGWQQVFWPLNIILVIIAMFYVLFGQGRGARKEKILAISPLLLLLFVASILGVGQSIYPEVRPSIGGGRPVNAIIQFNADGSDVLSFINAVHSDPNALSLQPNHRELPSIPRLTPVTLIYTTPETYVIGVYNCLKETYGYPPVENHIRIEHIFIIDRKLVSAISPLDNDSLDCK